MSFKLQIIFPSSLKGQKMTKSQPIWTYLIFNVQRCGAGFWTGYRNQARVTNVLPVAAGSAKSINLEVKGFIGCRFIASRLVRTELITCLWQICLIAKTTPASQSVHFSRCLRFQTYAWVCYSIASTSCWDTIYRHQMSII